MSSAIGTVVLADGSESELWLSIGEACVSLGSHEPCGHRTRNRRPESTDGIHFIILGRLANLIPVHTRYVPYGILHRALLSELHPHFSC